MYGTEIEAANFCMITFFKGHYCYRFVLFILSFEALDMQPTNRKCLIARAQCYQHIGEADKALADANETLREDSRFIKVFECYLLQYKFELKDIPAVASAKRLWGGNVGNLSMELSRNWNRTILVFVEQIHFSSNPTILA